MIIVASTRYKRKFLQKPGRKTYEYPFGGYANAYFKKWKFESKVLIYIQLVQPSKFSWKLKCSKNNKNLNALLASAPNYSLYNVSIDIG